MDKTSDPKHPHKKAADAYGGDALNPNHEVQRRIASVVKTGKKDELVTRWAHAFKTICPEPVQLQPVVDVELYQKALPEVRVHLSSPFLHREVLAKVAEAVGGKKSEEATGWAIAVLAL